MATDGPGGDSGSLSIASNDNRKVSREDIELVQNLIERCLQLYMNKGEVVRTLSTRARIEPGFTTLVWQKLEEENSEFFRAYYIRLKLKRQIILFNHLLQHQYNLMKYPAPPNVPLAPMQNGMHPMPGKVHAYKSRPGKLLLCLVDFSLKFQIFCLYCFRVCYGYYNLL
ncbi:Os01g0220200 [Oryza sativa Japonica Group]|uniref:Os01g0220200 protein n=1 Tax=Oryza sativa subsp. japonica TaxID=39947 RepID=Q0JPJ0_ORYSJ|nr:Os01g0220200 [Oryza sativa Japonica Group]|eukprot:NP_001042424.2 Os01g0220200 [Oryza sativa Japonica Group]